MTPDERVAVKVMGWVLVIDGHDDRYASANDPDNTYEASYPFWSPTTNPSHDYEVLKHVEENWELDDLYAFQLEIMRLEAPRTIHELYEPGDYSRAALAVLGEKG